MLKSKSRYGLRGSPYPSRKRKNRFLTRKFWYCFGFLAIIPLCALIGTGFLLSHLGKSLPSLENLERIEPPLISKVYDQDSVLIHEFYTERRIWTEYKDIPEILKKSVMSIEDRKFNHHWGVNLQAYPSALLPVLMGKRARGASTLTQQLAKNLFLTPERSIKRKIKEVILAVKIEQTYTKEEIMEFYMNQVYLGGGAYGFQAAAQKYFSTKLDSLSISQYALLAGLLQRPEAYRPDYFPDESRERRNLVLRAMYHENFIKKSQLVEALTEPIKLDVWNPTSLKAPYFVETIRQFLEKKWNEKFIYGKGVNVYSTLDKTIQEIADTNYQKHLRKVRLRIKYATARNMSMPSHMETPIDTLVRHWDSCYAVFDSLFINSKMEKERRAKGYKLRFPDSLHYRTAQMAVVVIENETGAVKALIGGEDYTVSKFNRAIQALRLPGSSFKPIVYTAALDNGGNPMDTLNDQPVTIPDPDNPSKTWRPKNYGNEFEGNMTMRRAFYRSKNLPAIKLAIQYGLRTVVSYARRFGLKHHIPAVPSIGIGTCEATLLEMTSAYTVFPNEGIRPEPYFIEAITDKDMNPIYRHIPKYHETIRKEIAYVMTTMLQDVNIRGTGAQIWASGFNRHHSGGKTGTTNNETDAWYIGFTKYYTAGVWVGTDDHKPLGRNHTGSRDAVPVWLDIMREVHKNLPSRIFSKSRNVVKTDVCLISGKRASDFCSRVASDYFIVGRQPVEVCNGNHSIRRNMNNVGAAFSSNKRRVFIRRGKDRDSSYVRVRNTF
jgi:penicillin-binding protein 1A